MKELKNSVCLLLAGGKSSRMGQDKSRLVFKFRLRQITVARYLCEILSPLFSSVYFCAKHPPKIVDFSLNVHFKKIKKKRGKKSIIYKNHKVKNVFFVPDIYEDFHPLNALKSFNLQVLEQNEQTKFPQMNLEPFSSEKISKNASKISPNEFRAKTANFKCINSVFVIAIDFVRINKSTVKRLFYKYLKNQKSTIAKDLKKTHFLCGFYKASDFKHLKKLDFDCRVRDFCALLDMKILSFGSEKNLLNMNTMQNYEHFCSRYKH